MSCPLTDGGRRVAEACLDGGCRVPPAVLVPALHNRAALTCSGGAIASLRHLPFAIDCAGIAAAACARRRTVVLARVVAMEEP